MRYLQPAVSTEDHKAPCLLSCIPGFPRGTLLMLNRESGRSVNHPTPKLLRKPGNQEKTGGG